MEDTTYSNLALKKKANPLSSPLNSEFNENFGLASLIDEYSKVGWEDFTEKKLLQALSFEFKNLLEIEDLRELVQDLIQIDHHLHLILDHVETLKNLGLESFYQNLSTLFIRMALEEEVNSDSMKRAIEIALEEEIYTWQERLQ